MEVSPMAKKIIALLLCLLMLLALAGCGKPRIVHCDRCGAEIQLSPEDKHITEDWILLCEDCGEPVIE